MYNSKQFEVVSINYINEPGIYAGAKLKTVELKGEGTPKPYYRFSFETDGRIGETSLFHKVDWTETRGVDEKTKKENAAKTEATNIRFVLALLSGLTDQKKIDAISEPTYEAYIERLIKGVISLKDKGVFNIKVIAKPSKDDASKVYCNVPANAGAVEPNVPGQSSTLYFTDYEKKQGWDRKEIVVATSATAITNPFATGISTAPVVFAELPPFVEPLKAEEPEGDLPF